MPTTADFLREIDSQLSSAESRGAAFVRINAGDLHRLIGGYPPKQGENHAMPTCCQAMWKRFDPNTDREIEVPPSRKGASLTLNYSIPRNL
jgi:5-methylcytosine-specific restriction protein A